MGGYYVEGEVVSSFPTFFLSLFFFGGFLLIFSVFVAGGHMLTMNDTGFHSPDSRYMNIY